ncbi:uncharacterized protein LOC141679970 [Apium graveolens]|uniref:uncharacterized protein LOC141679970 n=1 Tax=Apium graveolens TaxID=4045 RepID=UPI003D7B33EF
MTLEFGDPNLEGLKFPQDDPLVITPIIGNFPVIKVLVDNGVFVDIQFHDTFIRIGYNDSQLTPSDAPIYGFNHVECEVEGAIQLPINVREEPMEATDVLPIEDMDVRENDELRGKPSEDLVQIPLDPLDSEKVTYIGEVEKLLEAGFIEEVKFPEWLANLVMFKKANGKWRMCIDFTDLNDACPKDCYPLQRIDTLINATAGHEMLSFMDGFSGYNQIKMHKDDTPKISFITDFGVFCYLLMAFGL